MICITNLPIVGVTRLAVLLAVRCDALATNDVTIIVHIVMLLL